MRICNNRESLFVFFGYNIAFGIIGYDIPILIFSKNIIFRDSETVGPVQIRVVVFRALRTVVFIEKKTDCACKIGMPLKNRLLRSGRTVVIRAALVVRVLRLIRDFTVVIESKEFAAAFITFRLEKSKLCIKENRDARRAPRFVFGGWA